MMLNRKVMVDRLNLFSEKKLRPLRRLLSSCYALNANLNGLRSSEELKHSL